MNPDKSYTDNYKMRAGKCLLGLAFYRSFMIIASLGLQQLPWETKEGSELYRWLSGMLMLQNIDTLLKPNFY